MAEENILTRKIGPLPGWAWGAIAVGAGYILLQRFGSASGSQGQQSGLSPAASAIPFVPSVTVTGLPPSTQPSSSSTGTTTISKATLRGPLPGYTTVPLVGSTNVQSQGGTAEAVLQLPAGSSVDVTGQPVSGFWKGIGDASFYPVTYQGVQGYVLGKDVTNLAGGSGGGKGGFGVPAVTAMMGWTTGWGQATRTVRYPFGGAGGSPGITDRTAQSNSALYPSPVFQLGPRGYGGSSKSAWYPSLGAYGGKARSRSGVRRAQSAISPVRAMGFGGQNPRTQAGNSRLPGRRPRPGTLRWVR